MGKVYCSLHLNIFAYIKENMEYDGRGSSRRDKGVEIYCICFPTIQPRFDIYMFNLKKIASINFVNCQGHKQQKINHRDE